jgi:hypothetical protein
MLSVTEETFTVELPPPDEDEEPPEAEPVDPPDDEQAATASTAAPEATENRTRARLTRKELIMMRVPLLQETSWVATPSSVSRRIRKATRSG